MKKPAFAGLFPQGQSGHATIYYGSVVTRHSIGFASLGQPLGRLTSLSGFVYLAARRRWWGFVV